MLHLYLLPFDCKIKIEWVNIIVNLKSKVLPVENKSYCVGISNHREIPLKPFHFVPSRSFQDSWTKAFTGFGKSTK